MRFSDYINDVKGILLICFAGGLFFSMLLAAFGIGIQKLVLLWLCYCLILFPTLFYCWRKKSRRLAYLQDALEALEPKYLLAEIVDTPDSCMEQVYFEMLRQALKSMTDEVASAQKQNREYQEFVEQWVHEFKLPVTGIRLLCENHKTDVTRRILSQTERIRQDVEKVLFCARLGSVEKDYLIREISLRECVMEALARNKYFLVESGVSVHTENLSHSVRSDGQWIAFILNQLLSNSLKYRSDRPLVLTISSEACDTYVTLYFSDNGMGIRPSELGRIFDKGFVGSNGRNTGTSGGSGATGMGLYICAGLCKRLGIEIAAESDWNQSTTFRLFFPKNFLSI